MYKVFIVLSLVFILTGCASVFEKPQVTRLARQEIDQIKIERGWGDVLGKCFPIGSRSIETRTDDGLTVKIAIRHHGNLSDPYNGYKYNITVNGFIIHPNSPRGWMYNVSKHYQCIKYRSQCSLSYVTGNGKGAYFTRNGQRHRLLTTVEPTLVDHFCSWAY